MRLKTMMALEGRYVTLIETTYYQILPPETPFTALTVQLTPMQQFISHLIYQVWRHQISTSLTKSS